MKENKKDTDTPVEPVDRLFELHQMMQERSLILVYDGPFTQDITNAFLSITKQGIGSREDEKSTLRKLGFVLVECLQNVYKHSDGEDAGERIKPGSSIFVISTNDKFYILESGNRISNESIPSLESMLDHLNGLDREGKIELYKEQILTGSITEKGGAGLGLIDIAIKSAGNLEYHFRKIDDKYSFFSLRIKILRKKFDE